MRLIPPSTIELPLSPKVVSTEKPLWRRQSNSNFSDEPWTPQSTFQTRAETEGAFARYVSRGKVDTFRRYAFDAIMGERGGATLIAVVFTGAVCIIAGSARAEEAHPLAQTETVPRRSVPLMWTGAGLTFVGSGAILVGSALGLSDACLMESCPQKTGGMSAKETAGIVVVVSGVALDAIGIPLLVYGARHVAPPGPGSNSASLIATPGGARIVGTF